jgi:uncharacterized protein YbaR (Trm112 family)
MGSKNTGLVCPSCRQPVAIIERETADTITFRVRSLASSLERSAEV